MNVCKSFAKLQPVTKAVKVQVKGKKLGLPYNQAIDFGMLSITYQDYLFAIFPNNEPILILIFT